MSASTRIQNVLASAEEMGGPKLVRLMVDPLVGQPIVDALRESGYEVVASQIVAKDKVFIVKHISPVPDLPVPSGRRSWWQR